MFNGRTLYKVTFDEKIIDVFVRERYGEYSKFPKP